MYKTLSFCILSLLVFKGQAQSSYQIKSCKIDFVFFDGFQKGTKTLIFMDSGRTEKLISSTTYIYANATSESQKELDNKRVLYHSLIIQTTDSIFSVDLDSMTGSKKERFNSDMSSLVQNEEKQIEEDVFMGRKCAIKDFHGVKIWYWKGVALKKEMVLSENEKIYEYAVSIDENYIIKQDEFKIPVGVKMK